MDPIISVCDPRQTLGSCRRRGICWWRDRCCSTTGWDRCWPAGLFGGGWSGDLGRLTDASRCRARKFAHRSADSPTTDAAAAGLCSRARNACVALAAVPKRGKGGTKGPPPKTTPADDEDAPPGVTSKSSSSGKCDICCCWTCQGCCILLFFECSLDRSSPTFSSSERIENSVSDTAAADDTC